jgi:SAM-dependent methyltransferase
MRRETLEPDPFDVFEAAGWEEKAAEYSRFLGSITSRMSKPLLDIAAVTATSRVLDIGTGPGHVAAEAAARGATVVGVDVAEAMIELARRLHPSLDFRRADAYDLPFDDESFDAIIGNFVILHLGRPEQAAAEFARVLAPGGVLALTTWDLPERSRFPGLFVDAVAKSAVRSPEHVPAGPDFFRFAARGEFEKLFRNCGLERAEVDTMAFPLFVNDADELWNGLIQGTVRASALINGQPPEERHGIREAFDMLIDQHRQGGTFELPVSVKLAAARKPRGVGDRHRPEASLS